MALDRTWYNTLVDDDGSGMTGSVWDKADVDALMDATDAELAKTALAAGTWVPTITTQFGGTPIYGTQAGDYIKIGPLVSVQFTVTLTSRGTLTAGQYLRLAGLPVPMFNGQGTYAGGLAMASFGGMVAATSWVGAYLMHGATYGVLTHVPGAGGQSALGLLLENITDTFSLTGFGTYRASS